MAYIPANSDDRRSEGRECHPKGSKRKTCQQVRSKKKKFAQSRDSQVHLSLCFSTRVMSPMIFVAVPSMQRGSDNTGQNTDKWR